MDNNNSHTKKKTNKNTHPYTYETMIGNKL